MRCPVPKAKWRRFGSGDSCLWEMSVGPHVYRVLRLDPASRKDVEPVVGDDGLWVYEYRAYRTLKQAKARAEDDALDKLRKEAADLGLRVVEARR